MIGLGHPDSTHQGGVSADLDLGWPADGAGLNRIITGVDLGPPCTGIGTRDQDPTRTLETGMTDLDPSVTTETGTAD